MTHQEWIETVQADFFDAVTGQKSLDALSDCAYRLLGNPVLLTNERGEIFSKSQYNRPYNDALMEEFDTRGYVPREKRKYISAEHFSEKMRNDKVVVFDAAYISHRLMLYQTKVSKTFTLRTIMLESKRPFSEDDMQVFELFAKTATYFLKNSDLVRQFNSSSFEFFLHELISGRIDGVQNEKEIISYLSLKPGDRLIMLIAKKRNGASAQVSHQQLRAQLQAIFDNSISFVYDDHTVSFVNFREQQGLLHQKIDLASEFMMRSGFDCAVSRFFNSFYEIAEIYRQTADILNFCSGFNSRASVYFTSTFFSTYLFGQLDGNKVETMCFQPILELLESSKEQLLQTLYAYTLVMGNMVQTAQLLGVHYNTVKYRIQKIREILGIELDSSLPALYLSIKALTLFRKDEVECCLELDTVFRKWRNHDYVQ